MSATEVVEQFRKLPLADQREAFEQIREVVGDDAESELSPEQIAELDRRAGEFAKNPYDGIPFEQVREEARKRFGWK